MLIGGDETGKPFRIDPPVTMRDGLQGQVIDARMSGLHLGPSWLAQARQLLAVAFRQMAFRGAYLFFNQIEIVQQPLCRRGDLAAFLERLRHQLASFPKHDFVLCQPCQQLIARLPLPFNQLMRSGEDFAMLFHLHHTEKLGSQRRFVIAKFFVQFAIARKPHHSRQSGKEVVFGWFQCKRLFLSSGQGETAPHRCGYFLRIGIHGHREIGYAWC